MKKPIKFQVFERIGDGESSFTITHNFTNRRDAERKARKLRKAGKLEGDIWDCRKNPVSDLVQW